MYKMNNTGLLLSALCLMLTVSAIESQTSESNCPQWDEWQPWSDCLWGNYETGRRKIFEAYDIELDQWPSLPSPVSRQGRCGQCPWRTRIRKRHMRQGCTCVDIDWQQCDDAAYSTACITPLDHDVFSDPVVRELRCTAIELSKTFLRQCGAQSPADNWLRELNNAMWDATPPLHCAERDGECRCCCGKYRPSAEGDATQCVPMEAEGQCAEWGQFNDWSDECMWFNSPPEGMLGGIARHCAVDPADIDDPVVKSLLSPANAGELPERCGHCSFRAKCRSRSPFSTIGDSKTCFPLDVEKTACGPADCTGCGQPCALPKVEGGCDYANMVLNVAPEQRREIGMLPDTMRAGLLKLLTNLPFGRCVEIAGRCKCCCHPYEPTADGQSCQLSPPCRWPQPNSVDAYDALHLPKVEL